MKGRVNERREAILRLRIEGTNKRRRIVEGIIDTGYDGALTLPPKLIRQLKLPPLGQEQGELANGQIVTFKRYAATVKLNKRQVRIAVAEAQTDPLIGMELLDGFELKIEVQPRGTVTVKPLKRSARHK